MNSLDHSYCTLRYDKVLSPGRTAMMILFFLFTFSYSTVLKAQNAVFYAGSEIPLNYSAGVEPLFAAHWSADIRAGILTKPYDKIILDILKAFGTEEAITNTIGDAFDFGIVGQIRPHYRWKGNYVGIGYSVYFLKATNPPRELIESYYGISFPVLPLSQDRNLILNSTLHNAGITYGHDFTFRGGKNGLRLEVALFKTFYSKSSIRNSYGELPQMSAAIDDTLSEYYLDYGYLPSVGVFYIF